MDSRSASLLPVNRLEYSPNALSLRCAPISRLTIIGAFFSTLTSGKNGSESTVGIRVGCELLYRPKKSLVLFRKSMMSML